MPRGTRTLLALELAFTVIVGVVNTTNAYARGAPLAGVYDWLIVSTETFRGARLTALLTNGLVAAPSGLLGLVILFAFIAYFEQRRVRGWWHTHRPWLIGVPLAVLAAVALIDRFLLVGVATGLLADWIVLAWIAPQAERVWGAKRLLRFAATIMLATNTLAALILLVWPGGHQALLGGSASLVFGTRPLFFALVAVWAMSLGRRPLAGTPITGRHVHWLLCAMAALDMLLEGFAAGAMLAGALALAWLLVTGNWRPQAAHDRVRLFLIDRRLARRKRRLRLHQGGRAGPH